MFEIYQNDIFVPSTIDMKLSAVVISIQSWLNVSEYFSAENLDTPIVPRLLRDEHKANDAIFNVPILVASGLAPDSLRATLESLLDQEGLNTQMVLVTYDKEYSENADLASLFHVKSVAITSNGSYNGQNQI